MPLVNETPKLSAAQTIAARVRSTAADSFRQLAAMQAGPIHTMWYSGQAKPQEVCDALGTDAAAAFIAHGKLTEFVVGMATELGIDYKPALPLKNFTINPDGTVTVSEDPFTPPAS